jgi:hypothetical protein
MRLVNAEEKGPVASISTESGLCPAKGQEYPPRNSPGRGTSEGGGGVFDVESTTLLEVVVSIF